MLCEAVWQIGAQLLVHFRPCVNGENMVETVRPQVVDARHVVVMYVCQEQSVEIV